MGVDVLQRAVLRKAREIHCLRLMSSGSPMDSFVIPGLAKAARPGAPPAVPAPENPIARLG
jgi:hypothetical protein